MAEPADHESVTFAAQLRRIISIAAVVVLAALAIARGVDLWQRYHQALEIGNQRAANLALILAEYLSQVFQSIDGMTRQAVFHSRRVGGPSAATEDWRPTLESLIAGTRSIGSLSIVDSDGIIRHSTLAPIVGQSRRDEYLFRRLATDGAAGTVASTPFRSIVGSGFLIPLGRRLETSDGRFEGIVAATFVPDQLRGFFKAVDVGRNGVISVFHPERIILFREPSTADPIGHTAAINPILDASMGTGGSGSLRSAIEPGGPTKLTAFATLPAPALVVAVSLDESEVLADWREALAASIGLFVVIVAATTAILHQLFRQLDARAAAEAALARSQRLEAVGRLTGGIAHDFNNIITVVLGHCHRLKTRVAAPLMSSVEEIDAAARRAAELTQRMLAFARRQPLQPRIVDMNQLLTASLMPMLPRLLGEDVSVKTHLAPQPCWANVDPVQVETALMNLCINARDAMPEGGLLILETGREVLDEHYARANTDVTPGRYVLVAVSDTGAGIAPEHLERVFEPFFTTKGPGEGTGLGLSMVHGFVKQSRGHVKIYSETGHGTTVKLYFPEASEAAEAPRIRPEGPAQRGTGQTILLVEDEEAVRKLASGMLRELGYRVLTASDAPSALSLAREHSEIDLLFTDVVLPKGMNGRQLAEEVRLLRPSVRILYTSGYSENVILHRGQLDPGIRLLSKPYDKERLAASLAETLRG